MIVLDSSAIVHDVANAPRGLAARATVSAGDARRELREHITAYDTIYVALAEALDATLVTTDARLARSHGHRARIVAPE